MLKKDMQDNGNAFLHGYAPTVEQIELSVSTMVGPKSNFIRMGSIPSSPSTAKRFISPPAL